MGSVQPPSVVTIGAVPSVRNTTTASDHVRIVAREAAKTRMRMRNRRRSVHGAIIVAGSGVSGAPSVF